MEQHPGTFSDSGTGAQPCNLAVTDDTLLIYLLGNNKQLIIWNLKSISGCVFNGSALIVNYRNSEQKVECAGTIAQQIHAKWLRRDEIKTPDNKISSSKIFIVLFILLLVLGIFVAAWFIVVPWAGRKAADMIPVETEIELGKNIAQTYEVNSAQNDTLNRLINQFVSALKIEGPYPIKTGIIVSDEINAFALPGGRIFVYSGIIKKMNSYEELVALLSHESSHVVKRHSLKSICSSAASGILLSSVFGDVAGVSSAILAQADEFKQLDYSRELETEADDEGYELMLRNKVNPQGMLDLLKLLKQEGESMPVMMKYLSTHPDTEERIRNIEQKPGSGLVFENNPQLDSLFRSMKRSLPPS